jgi:hypothetical protein
MRFLPVLFAALLLFTFGKQAFAKKTFQCTSAKENAWERGPIQIIPDQLNIMLARNEYYFDSTHVCGVELDEDTVRACHFSKEKNDDEFRMTFKCPTHSLESFATGELAIEQNGNGKLTCQWIKSSLVETFSLRGCVIGETDRDKPLAAD